VQQDVYEPNVTEQNVDKSTFLMDLLNAFRLEKSTTLRIRGTVFHTFAAHTAKNSDLVVQLLRHLNL